MFWIQAQRQDISLVLFHYGLWLEKENQEEELVRLRGIVEELKDRTFKLEKSLINRLLNFSK